MAALFLYIIFSVAWPIKCMPLSKRMIDLTYVFDETTLNYPAFKKFEIDSLVNGSQESFGGLWLQAEEYSSATHVGTHMDSPAHFIKGGMTIDEIPVTEFVAPAAVIDITAKAELDTDAVATIEDLMQWESGTGQTLNGTIIMLRSGWGKKWNDSAAFYGTSDNNKDHLHFPGMAGDACQWLVDNRSVKGIGIDTLSLDQGISKDFPCHVSILEKGMFILENVANLDKIPIYGAKLYVFPMKIGKASGAPARIVATVPEVIYDLHSNLLTNHI